MTREEKLIDLLAQALPYLEDAQEFHEEVTSDSGKARFRKLIREIRTELGRSVPARFNSTAEMIRFADLVRSPPGTVSIIEYSSLEERRRKINTLQSYATRTKAKLRMRSINGFDTSLKPCYLLAVEVRASGQPRKRRGRKKRGD